MPVGPRIRSVGRGISLAAAAALIALLGAELALALTDYPPAYNDHQRFLVEYDSLRGWRNIPGAKGRLISPEFSVEMEYNAHAYRGPLHPYAKPAGTFRVLLLGDSFLEAYTVALRDRVAEVAAKILQSEHRPVEVVALGTGGYSTDQELLWLESEGFRYHPDLVVVLFCTNDIWYNNRADYPRGMKPVFRVKDDSLVLTNVPVPHPTASAAPEPESPVGRFLAAKRFAGRRSRLYRLAQRAVRRSVWLQSVMTRWGLMGGPLGGAETSNGRVTVPLEYTVFADRLSPEADSAVAVTERLLAEMQRQVRASGAQLVAMLVPPNEALYPPGAPQSTHFVRVPPFGDPYRANERVRTICDRAGIACVDPTARFVAVAESLAPRGRLLVFEEDEHWNEQGHRVAASALADIVRAAMASSNPPRSSAPTSHPAGR